MSLIVSYQRKMRGILKGNLKILDATAIEGNALPDRVNILRHEGRLQGSPSKEKLESDMKQ